MSLLKVKNLNISYPTRKETIVASKDVEFTLERGEILGIVGESGSGKSTIANAIINLIDPPGEITDGSIKIDNNDRDFTHFNNPLSLSSSRDFSYLFSTLLKS